MSPSFSLRCVFLLALLPVLARAGGKLPYVLEDAFDRQFNQPVGIVSAPGDANRLFILEKPGRILVIPDLNHPRPKTFLDLRKLVGSDDVEQGVLSLAFHPDFRRNREFYVWYTYCHDVNGETVREDRLARFKVSADDPDVAEPRSQEILIAQADRAPNHNGGELAFGPDGYLYLSLGDEGKFNDDFNNAQLIDHNFFAGILRLDVDRRPGNLPPNPHPAVRAGTYLVPQDNPFVGVTSFGGRAVDPKRVRTEFWAVGLRNPWRMSFNAADGSLWCADVGQDKFEEVNVIKRGGNYGWHLREGAGHFRDTEPPGARFDEAVWIYSHKEGQSITGGVFCDGARYPGLKGKYLFADYVSNRIWALTPDGDRPVAADAVRQIAEGDSVVSFGRDPRNGDILIASYGRERIYRLVPAPR